VAAVKFFLLRRVRGRETPGCNPSKVAPDGRTPLQIAIVGGNAEMVALMTKEATVHDVERCWPLPDAAPFKVTLLEKVSTDPN
jgi:ankyrin repeat protein